MGWNLSLVHARGPAATIDGFARANGYQPDPRGSVPTMEEFVFGSDDGGWGRPAVAVAETDSGLVLLARLILTHDWTAGLSVEDGSATWALWQSITTNYGFAHYQGGTLEREIQRSEYETIEEKGSPLPEEAQLRWHDSEREPDDEDDLFALVELVTGLPDISHVLDGPGRLYRPAPEPPPLKKKRRLFGR